MFQWTRGSPKCTGCAQKNGETGHLFVGVKAVCGPAHTFLQRWLLPGLIEEGVLRDLCPLIVDNWPLVGRDLGPEPHPLLGP